MGGEVEVAERPSASESEKHTHKPTIEVDPNSLKWECARDKPEIRTKCNCKKTKCLKLYCECFANQQFCQKSCRCVDKLCMNTVANVAKRKFAVRRLVNRNPLAFVPKTSTKRSCRCQRSRCQKKYCECF